MRRRRLPHEEARAWSIKHFPWQNVEEASDMIRDRANMALLFLSRIDAHMERQTAALEKIAAALAGLREEAPRANAEEEAGSPSEGMERFFVESKRRPRRPRKKRSGEWKPGPCPTHGKLLDEDMMCVDCYKELEEWKTTQEPRQSSN